MEIENAIAESPADGLTRILIKLALIVFYGHHNESRDGELARASYETIVKLTGGVDLAANVERW